MGWLRRDQDCIGLVLAWSLLLQAAILSFSSGLQVPSASQLGSIICTTRSAAAGTELPAQNRHGTDCQCCVLGCHLTCGGAVAAIVPAVSFLLTTFSSRSQGRAMRCCRSGVGYRACFPAESSPA